MGKRYFISHSSADKPLAIDLKDLLEGDAWVDLHEIEIGDLLLAKISAGIEEATDFLLLWSAASASSRWVEFEFNMAFARWIQSNAIRLQIIRIDETPVPLHFQPFLQARAVRNASDIVSLLVGESPLPEVRHRSFFNRNSEIGFLEDALYASSPIAVWISGMGGIGKRALAQEAVNRLTSGTDAYRRVKIGPGVAEPELNLLVASVSSVPPLSATATLAELRGASAAIMVNFAEAGGIWIFEEADDWLEDDATFGRMAIEVLEALGSLDDKARRLAIFTSRRRPRIENQWLTVVTPLVLRGLAPHHSITMLRDRGATDTDIALGEIATELDGHPLALELIAPQLPMLPRDFAEHRFSIASDLIDPTRHRPTTWQMLEILAVIDGPLPVHDLAENLAWNSETIQSAIAEASSYGLVEYNELGFIYLHPILRDYFLRSYRKNPTNHASTVALAELSKARFDAKETSEPDYVISLLTTFKLLGMAGRFDDARQLRAGLIGTLFSTANVLYQEKRWEEALAYLEEALTGNDQVDRDALLLKAKCLAYLGRIDEARALGDQQVDQNPSSPKVLRDRGRIEFIARNWDGAIKFFERALPLRRNNSQLYSDIAQALVRKEDWTGAAAAAKTAIDLKGDTPYTLNLYSQALEEQGLLEEAEEMIVLAIQREPRNPRYLHRSGRILQRLGKRDAALEQYVAAIEIDPDQIESWLSIASLKIDSGEIESALLTIERAEKLPGAPTGVVSNLKARVSLARGNLADAQTHIDAAMSKTREPQNISLAVKIMIARAQAGLITRGQAQASVRLLAKELDRGGHLSWIKDSWEQHPDYF